MRRPPAPPSPSPPPPPPLLLAALAVALAAAATVAAALEPAGECGVPLGMEENRIPDSAISASSSYEEKSVGPQNAR
ncbi:hypothetical protein R5R35_013452 [Gryllus longicercus]|uniref:F5/8 type C domain-containing protein n=1 Tax=Gryllus longicercus TaxID=2509291 RepID=A0AAN9YYQ6_9ORTH